jgi:electron transfer flavoprotein beta subunit
MNAGTARRPTVLVPVKHVPVGGGFLRPDSGHLSREGVSHGPDPVNEVALEWSVRARETGSATRVVATSLGPPDATETLRRASAMGADELVLVTDPSLRGADVRTTARVLAAVARRVAADLVAAGYESLDGSSGAVPAATAAILDWPVVSRCTDAQLTGRTLSGVRDLETGPEAFEVDLPVVASFVTGQISPRYPKLKDLLGSSSAEPTTLSATDLEVALAASGETTIGLVAQPQPARQRRVVGAAEGIRELVELLGGGDHS